MPTQSTTTAPQIVRTTQNYLDFTRNDHHLPTNLVFDVRKSSVNSDRVGFAVSPDGTGLVWYDTAAEAIREHF